jgi:group I intron endonuclease
MAAAQKTDDSGERKPDAKVGIYAFVNLTDGKRYVGQASDISKRERQHLNALRRGDHRNTRFQRAYVRDGKDAFQFEILELCAPDVLAAREQFWMDHFAVSGTYNICPAGGSSLGVKRSAETRAKLSAAKKGVKRGPVDPAVVARGVQTRIARWSIIPKSSGAPESHQRRAEALKARWAVTPKKPPSAEAKARMSEAAKRRWQTNPLSPEAILRATESRAKTWAMTNGCA